MLPSVARFAGSQWLGMDSAVGDGTGRFCTNWFVGAAEACDEVADRRTANCGVAVGATNDVGWGGVLFSRGVGPTRRLRSAAVAGMTSVQPRDGVGSTESSRSNTLNWLTLPGWCRRLAVHFERM